MTIFFGLAPDPFTISKPTLSQLENVGRGPGQLEGGGPKILQFAHLRRH